MNTTDRPEIVCLCGSTRFFTEFCRQNYELTLAGKIVLSVGVFSHSALAAHGHPIELTPGDKQALDHLHKHKIDLCDRVFVLNVGGYIGPGLRSEIEYALTNHKRIEYLERVE